MLVGGEQRTGSSGERPSQRPRVGTVTRRTSKLIERSAGGEDGRRVPRPGDLGRALSRGEGCGSDRGVSPWNWPASGSRSRRCRAGSTERGPAVRAGGNRLELFFAMADTDGGSPRGVADEKRPRPGGLSPTRGPPDRCDRRAGRSPRAQTARSTRLKPREHSCRWATANTGRGDSGWARRADAHRPAGRFARYHVPGAGRGDLHLSPPQTFTRWE